jgi:hypothetical protein
VNGTLNGKESDSVFNIVRLLLENFTAELLRRIQNDQGIRIRNEEATSNGIRFCYPVLYIGAMRGTQNIDEVKTAHRRRLTAIVNFLHDYPETLKEVEFEGFVTDVHPYEYAMTLITGGITLEVHSELQPQTGHLLELQQTLIVSEFPVIELFALRYYNETISQLLSKPLQGVQSITAGIAVIGLYISVLAALTGGRKAAVAFLLITGAAYLAASVISNLVRKRKLVFSVTLLRNKQILRDTYLQRTLDQYGEVFPIQDLLASLTQKLAALDGIFDSFFRIGIAVVTILFALFAATWLDFDVERALGDIGSLFRRLAGY